MIRRSSSATRRDPFRLIEARDIYRNGITKPLPEELFVELLRLRAWGDAKIGA